MFLNYYEITYNVAIGFLQLNLIDDMALYFVHTVFVSDTLGFLHIPGSSCNSTTVGSIAERWKCGQFDWTIYFLPWVN